MTIKGFSSSSKKKNNNNNSKNIKQKQKFKKMSKKSNVKGKCFLSEKKSH